MFIVPELLMAESAPIPDGGMRYTETNMSHLIPEPLNTLSSCIFIGIALYWAYKLRNQYSSHIFLTICVSILFIGSIGGTLYHGLRRYHIFLFMDYMPIMILCLLAGIYFLLRVLSHWYYGLIILLCYVGGSFILRKIISSDDRHFLININYGMLASLVLIPTFLFLRKIRFREGKWVGVALISFIIALFFRIEDPAKLLPAGTHFLWHTFGALAVYCMLNFIFLTQNDPKDVSQPAFSTHP